MNIQGLCRSNDDAIKSHTWPTRFVAVPRVGEKVYSINGLRAKVYSVTHYMDRNGEPRIEVELCR